MKNAKKLLFLLVCILLFGGSYFLLKGTRSENMDSNIVKFDYSLDLDDDKKMINNLTVGITVSELLNKIKTSSSTSIIVNDSKGIKKSNSAIIATGDTLIISNGSSSSLEYRLSLIGDTSGDGNVDMIDLIQIRKHIAKYEVNDTDSVEIKKGVYFNSIDLNSDDEVDLVDLIRMRKILIGNIEAFFIKLNVSNTSMTVGESLQMEHSIFPSNVVDSRVTWVSSDSSVATVSNGLVKAVNPGTATITVKASNDVIEKCVVTVKEKTVTNVTIEAKIDKLRDPFVLVENGVYYVYGTGWRAYKNDSGSLDGSWEALGVVVQKNSSMSADFWAPEVYKYNGSYYMFATYKSSVTGHRGTSVMKADSPEGPFVEISNGHVTPSDWDSIDGTLYIDKTGQPWMIFVHEWTCTSDGYGRMAVAKLSNDLTTFISNPIELFRADSPSWTNYKVTDGPWMYETEDGQLLMLWSNLDSSGNYAVGIARSSNGKVDGKWTQDSNLLYSKSISGTYDGGHGMIFTDTNGQMYLSIHAPNTATATRNEKPTFIPIYEDDGTLKIVK